MTRLDKNLAALATMSPAQLREHWGGSGTDAAPAVPTLLLRRLLAQRLQEKRHGRLPLLVVRELERAGATRSVEPQQTQKKVVLTPGTRLIGDWNGQTIAVEVREDGFYWNDGTYRSLSEIAREVTGAHWSGPRFFGISRRG
jgi:hypothetical protein